MTTGESNVSMLENWRHKWSTPPAAACEHKDCHKPQGFVECGSLSG